MSVNRANGRTSLRELLALDDIELCVVIEELRDDESGAYDYCRAFGALLKLARRQRASTLHELSVESGMSARTLWLVEEGALLEEHVPDEALERVAELLEVDLDELLSRAESLVASVEIATVDAGAPGELVAEIPPQRDGLWLHSKQLPLRLARDGDYLLVGPAPELAYSRITVTTEDMVSRAHSTYIPNSGRARVQLPESDRALCVYLG